QRSRGGGRGGGAPARRGRGSAEPGSRGGARRKAGKKPLAPRNRCDYVGFAAWTVRVRTLFRRHSLIREPARRSLGLRSLVGEDGMRQSALFQLGTGLGTPGTARKEDF